MDVVNDIAEDLPTRKTLVRKLKNIDDHQSWREFFETYWRLLYSFAIKSGCTEAEAEEVVQETIVSVARKMPDFSYDPGICSFKGWLMHVANWRVIDQLRKRNHRLAPIPNEPGTNGTSALERIPDPLGPEIERLWHQEWQEKILIAAIEKVKRRCNPEHYQIFYLANVKRKSPSDIAGSLGVSRGRIYLAKHRVAKMVKAEVKRLEQEML